MATDDLIAELTAVGRVDSHGSFSLDREKAREKLRTFQVAEPQRHALHLVALAVLKGATKVTITCDSDDLVVEFDGAPVTAEDLDDLYNSSFAAARDDVQRARQQLAVGLHAAMALNPRSVRLVSGSGATAVQLVARPGQPDEIGAPRQAPGGTRIHVKQRFRPGLVVRFARYLKGTLAEAVLLRERCVHASIPITLNGAAISGGLALPGGVSGVEGSAGPLRGVAGLRPGGDGVGAIRLVRHGVWICEDVAEHFPFGALAVVAHDGLLTDLSGQQVVHDDERRRCVELAEQLMTDAIAAALGPGEAVEPEPGLRALLRPVWARWAAALMPDSELGRALARVRVWPDVWGRPHTLAALRAEAERLGHLPLADAALALTLPPTDEIIIHRGDPHVDEVLAVAFAERTRDVGGMLATRARTEANRRRWRAQPAEPTLVAANYLLVAPFQARHGERRVTGQAGLRRAAGERCSLRVIVDGCELAELELDAPIAGVDAVLSGDLALADDFSGPARDELFAACLVAWLGAARVLVEAGLRQGRLRWAPGPALQALLYGYTRALQRDEATCAVLMAGGFAGDPLLALQRDLAAALPATSVPEDMSEQPWMSDAFTFASASGPELRLGAVALALRKGVEVRWVPDSYEGDPQLSALVLRVDARGQDLLRWLFCGRVARMAQDEYASLRARAEFMRRPVQPLTPRGPGLLPGVMVEQGGLKVAMTFPRTREAWLTASHRAQCQICHGGRPLAQVTVWSPVPGVHLGVAVAIDDLTVGKHWDSVVQDDAFHATMLRAAAAIPALVVTAVTRAFEADRAARDGWRPAVLAALAASVPTPTLRSVYARLYAQSRDDADGHYERLLALGATAGVDLLSHALASEARSVAQLCDVPRLAQELSVPPPTPAGRRDRCDPRGDPPDARPGRRGLAARAREHRVARRRRAAAVHRGRRCAGDAGRGARAGPDRQGPHPRHRRRRAPEGVLSRDTGRQPDAPGPRRRPRPRPRHHRSAAGGELPRRRPGALGARDHRRRGRDARRPRRPRRPRPVRRRDGAARAGDDAIRPGGARRAARGARARGRPCPRRAA